MLMEVKMTISTNAHVFTWMMTLILFIMTISFQKKGKTQIQKAISYLLRLFYLFVIGTGFFLLRLNYQPVEYILKAVAGLWVIAMFEMIVARTKQGKNGKIFFWIQLIVAFIVALYLGYKLPLGHSGF